MSFWSELKRRHVVRAGLGYIVVAWVALQVADVILNNIEAPSWIFQVILLCLAIGFPVVLVVAWAFELTSEGLKRDEDLKSEQTTAPGPRRFVDLAVIVLLVAAVAYFALDKFVLSPGRDDAAAETEAADNTPAAVEVDNSIAVLPFVNMSSDAEQEFFSDGLSEELLNLLARIPELRVIARTSSFSYKGKDTRIAEISEELNVSYLLEGSVRKSGDKVRITAQLIRSADSSHIWSETYDRKLDDIFAIQDEIASAVVGRLRISLLGAVPTVQETNPEAYSLYLQARELGRRSTKEGHEKSIELYRSALAIAPDYASAWAGLAENYIFLADRSLMPIDEGFALAREYSEKALSIDPNYALAHASLGWIAMVHDSDLTAAAQHIERALEIDPSNPLIIRPAATLSTNLLRLEQAIDLLEYAALRDPVSSRVHANLALAYFCAGHLDEARAAYETALTLSPDAIGLHSFLGTVLLSQNELEAGLAEMQREKSEAWRLIGLAMAHHALGQNAESDTSLAELLDKYGAEWPYNISYVFAYRGEADRAFEWLERARQYNDPGLSEVASAPEFDNIKSDPRWLPLLESIGKSPQQLTAVDFKVTLAD